VKQSSPFLVACLLLAGCHPARNRSDYPTPAAFVHWKDKAIGELALWGIPAGTPCETGTHLENGFEVADPIQIDQCLRFGKPKRMHGFWLDQFEGSQFCPMPSAKCFYQSPESDTWLDFNDPSLQNRRPTGGLYEIEFIGRHSLYPASYGHMGGFSEEVIVDRVISIEQLKAPPKD
jgi:hypothetical protein